MIVGKGIAMAKLEEAQQPMDLVALVKKWGAQCSRIADQLATEAVTTVQLRSTAGVARSKSFGAIQAGELQSSREVI